MYRHNNCNQIVSINNIFRKLWEQHVMWTRSYIISVVDNLKDLEFVTKRLLRNPVDFKDVFMQYYGNQIANQFQNLLEEHLLIAADLVNNAKSGNTVGADAARKKWYENADEIAMFLAKINLYWNEKEWQSLLYGHLKMTEEEEVTRLQGKYQENVTLYDDIENQALNMADYMTRGILKQFT